MPSKKTAKGGGLSASDFIRSQPRNMTAPQLVEAGKKQGLKFSGNLVYAVRAADKKKANKGLAPKKAARAAASGGASPEAAFRRLIVDLGVARSRALVSQVEGALAKVIRGA